MPTRGRAWLVAGAILGALVLLAWQARVRVYHDGVCGYQKWERLVLWMDFSEYDYDEFGIPERWMRAHGRPCERIWTEGSLGPGVSDYWPRLHFRIAAGAGINELKRNIIMAQDAELSRKDALGRTIMHWLAVHPDRNGSAELEAIFVGRGMRLDEKDNDGLTPTDWAESYRKSAGG